MRYVAIFLFFIPFYAYTPIDELKQLEYALTQLQNSLPREANMLTKETLWVLDNTINKNTNYSNAEIPVKIRAGDKQLAILQATVLDQRLTVELYKGNRQSWQAADTNLILANYIPQLRLQTENNQGLFSHIDVYQQGLSLGGEEQSCGYHAIKNGLYLVRAATNQKELQYLYDILLTAKLFGEEKIRVALFNNVKQGDGPGKWRKWITQRRGPQPPNDWDREIQVYQKGDWLSISEIAYLIEKIQLPDNTTFSFIIQENPEGDTAIQTKNWENNLALATEFEKFPDHYKKLTQIKTELQSQEKNKLKHIFIIYETNHVYSAFLDGATQQLTIADSLNASRYEKKSIQDLAQYLIN